ncbi:MAG: phosphoglucosamine mutase [Bacteriovoracaceae bacterium]
MIKQSQVDKRKLFGTDGIRGKANSFPMTAEVAIALGRAVTHYFQKSENRHSRPLIIVGKDTRRSCYMLEQAFAAGVCSQGGEAILTGPLPTPGVAFCTQSMRADAGVMISASHNPYDDNGIKLFDANGYKLPDEVELEIENLILDQDLIPTKFDSDLGKAQRLKHVFGRYVVQVKSALDKKYDLEGMRIVLDCANGAGYKVAPMIFEELGAEVITRGTEPNGTNINHECGSLYPERAQEMVKKYRADLGICLDGDADRLIVIDDQANIINGDVLIGLLTKLSVSQKRIGANSEIVGTVMSNLGLEKYIKSLGLSFHRTKVGDRYIVERMRESGALIGGEPSGHIVFHELATTGDGCLAALKVIEAIKHFDRKLSQLATEVKLFPQVIKNTKVKKKIPFEELPNFQKVLEASKEKLGDKGRVVVRYSGTESLARVMVEAETDQLVSEISDDLTASVQKELG